MFFLTLISIPSLIFWPQWSAVLVAIESSGLVASSRVLAPFVTFGVLDALFASGFPGFWERVWPLVELGTSARVVDQDMVMGVLGKG